MSTNDLLLAKKIEEFLFEICVKTDSFPKFERYSLTGFAKKSPILFRWGMNWQGLSVLE